MKITDYNIDGTSVTRDMDDAELAQYEAQRELAAALEAEKAKAEAAKAELLERLGITAEEAALLLA
jgi:hypothetical protein